MITVKPHNKDGKWIALENGVEIVNIPHNGRLYHIKVENRPYRDINGDILDLGNEKNAIEWCKVKNDIMRTSMI